MKIYVTDNVLVGGRWHEPGVGDYDPELAKHLISLGVARAVEPMENKMLAEPMENKKKVLQSSQPDPASAGKTAKKSKKAK